MKTFLLTTSMCLLVYLASCGGRTIKKLSNPQEPNDPENQAHHKKIVFLGDSLTAGPGLSEEERYSNRIQDKITNKKLPWKVLNEGVSGNTIKDGLDRVDF